MNDADLDDLVLSAARVSNDEVEEFGLVGDRDALSLAIVERRKLPMAGPLSSVLRAGSAIGVVLALLAAVAVTVRSPGGGGSSPAYAQELVALAESNPRLLIDAPGWEVISVHEASPSSGMIHFSNGVRELNLSWAVDPRPEPSSPPAFERRLAVGDG
ncbi:MAG: hypothetical protein WD178_01845, partial [Actinomycetota bacterium]